MNERVSLGSSMRVSTKCSLLCRKKRHTARSLLHRRRHGLSLRPSDRTYFNLFQTSGCFRQRRWWRRTRTTGWRCGTRCSRRQTRTGTPWRGRRPGGARATGLTPLSPNTPSTRPPASRKACGCEIVLCLCGVLFDLENMIWQKKREGQISKKERKEWGYLRKCSTFHEV